MIVKMNVGDAEAQLGSNGVTFKIYDNDGTYVGRFRLGKATVEWAPRNAKMGAKGKARQIKLTRFIDEYLDQL